jgi:hypothetical protein
MNGLLRAVAILIAVAGVVDPAIPMSGATRARLAVVTATPASADSVAIRDRVAATLAASFDVVPQVTSDSAAAVVVGDRYPEDPLPDTLLISTITTEQTTAPSVRVVRVNAPREVPPATTIHLDVEVEGLGVAGTSTDLSARIAGLEVARASHQWSGASEYWRAGLDAVPVGDPPWVVETSVVTSNAVSRAVDTVVDLRRTPLRVMFYEPRPSWATTFVRRALEADRRFESAGVSFSSRGIAARTGDAVSLSDPRIDAADLIVVGGLDRLSAPDGRSLDRFMRIRGGAVVLVPDARIGAGPARDLLSQSSLRLELSERLLERSAKLVMPANVAPLEASELLVFGALPPGADVVAATAGADPVPVAASMPYGGGRLLVSGAMDAWRFRANDNGAFDRFWQSTLAGLALAAPPPIDVAVEPPFLRPFERGEVVVRVRSREYAELAATMNGDQPIRLRPEPEAGVYRGTFTAAGVPGRSTIDVHAAGAAQPGISRSVLVRAVAHRAGAKPPLAMLASSHRGIDVAPDRIADLARFLLGAVDNPRATVVRRPMRSAWWMLPFATCLCGEWWRRRRRGLR